MKKILSVILSIIMIFSLVALVGCGEKEPVSENYKFGMGTYSYIGKTADADGDTNGEGQVVVNAAAVLLSEDGKIVKCVIDVADNTVAHTSEGKVVVSESFQTKKEKGNAYGMVAYGGAEKEWFEQAEIFANLCVGKTADEVAALEGAEKKGTEDVINAGCTIMVNEFVAAVKAAVSNAAAASVSKDDTLKIGVVSVQEGKDVTDENETGSNKVVTTVVAAAVAKDGKVTAIATDDIQAEFKFDEKGVKAADATVSSKLALGDNYGMAQYGADLNKDGKVLEWYAQAEAFNAACVGKTAAEISALAAENGYGSDALQTAGCTIAVSTMVKAAVKAATVA